MLACPDTEVLIHAWPSFYPWQSFPRLTWIDLQRRKKERENYRQNIENTLHGMEEEEQGEGREELPSIQARGKDAGGFISRVMHTHASAGEHPPLLHKRGIHEPAAASDHFPSWIGSKGALRSSRRLCRRSLLLLYNSS